MSGRISFPEWNEFINDGEYFKTHTCTPAKSGLTIDLQFLDQMLAKGKIDEFEHQKLRVKTIANWKRFYNR